MWPGIWEFITHIDSNFPLFIDTYGFWTYAILMVIITCETGLVITTFLPGDSLLFVAGAAAAAGLLSLPWLFLLFFLAAVAGDCLNYWIGHNAGVRVVKEWFPDLMRREYLERTSRYFQRFGAKAIFVARFIPIIRTFAPFLAGVGAMDFRTFLLFNALSAAAWSVAITSIGFLFGTHPFIRDHIIWFIYGMGILILATVPVMAGALVRSYLKARKMREQVE
jgi:membrane-associated protein